MQGAGGPEFGDLAAGGAITAIALGVSLFIYLYFSITLMIIARKTNTPGAILAWIPLLNLFLMCRIARMPGYSVLLLMIPLVNIFVAVQLWMGMAEARGKPAWTGLLIFIPPINIFIPLYLAMGRGAAPRPSAGYARAPAPAPTPAPTPPPPAARPSLCPKCQAPLAPEDAFCSACGQAAPAPTPAPAPVTVAPTATAAVAAAAAVAPAPAPVAPQAPPAKSSGCLKGCLLGCVGVMVVLVLAVGIGWYALGRMLEYTPPQKNDPALTARMAGALTEFPIDTDTVAPAQPTSVVAQEFGQGGSSQVTVPQPWLPPGVKAGDLPGYATGVSSAVYRTGAKAPPAYVHVLGTQQGQPITSAVAQATGGTTSRVRVQSPRGEIYNGSLVESGTVTLYVLVKQSEPITIVVYSPDPASAGVAKRLAGNVGNGRGLTDYARTREALAVLPAMPPPGLTLREANLFSPSDLESVIPAGGDAESQAMVRQVQQFLPGRLTVGRYVDGNREDWGVIVCDFESTRRAWGCWKLVEMTTGLNADFQKTTVLGVKALQAQPDGPVLLFRKGPYLSIIVGPSGGSEDLVAALANSLQM